ncbi:acyl carrier protein [Nocardia tengchongensis]|uniref:acyl carrier protein n=1 Tax=Nocardia tengchongensis TaxID=2055889 RepID=UPI0036B0D174
MTLANLTDQDLAEKISEVAATIDTRLVGLKLGLDDGIAELGIDSITTMELIVKIEDSFGLDFPDDVLATVVTVRDLVVLIRQG